MSTEYQYELLSGMYDYELESEVKQWIKDGWRPIGGPCSHKGDIVQAMVREVPPDRQSDALERLQDKLVEVKQLLLAELSRRGVAERT